jgi:DNA polymerase-3 subunit epsilon
MSPTLERFASQQLTLEHAVPLREVTFAVVDLETTGGSPDADAITEIGAVKVRGGERLGTFQTLVDPGRPIPRSIAMLTGIDDRTVAGAPPIGAVLPSLVEFLRGTVFVAHNARFDHSFLNASLVRSHREPIPGPIVCTAKLARRVVWPDVPNVRLQTLARYFRTRVQPSHRALADAEATTEVLLGLLDVGGHLGIATLAELFLACSARGRPNFGKIGLARELPAVPGVYIFRSRDDRILYVGKSKNLRARATSYFYGDERKKMQDLLGEVASIDGLPTPGGELEALVVEARMISLHEPPYNRHGTRWRSYSYLALDPHEPWPRLKTTRAPREGTLSLGPFPSQSRAKLAAEALEEVFPLRRCGRAMGRRTRFPPCALADMGRCQAPCDGRTTPERYGELVGTLRSAVASPGELLGALEDRMRALARQERFEEASSVRDRAGALAEALWRARADAWLTRGELVLRGPEGVRLVLREGSLVSSHGDPGPIGWPPPRQRADELAAVRSWIARHPLQVVAGDTAPAEAIAGGRELAGFLRRLREGQADPGERSRTRGRGRDRVSAA